jgi:endonuclease/exonuclease/phosphatase family metal-dependent hydrolase
MLLKFAVKIAFWLNAFLLLISLLAVHINPATFWPPAFIALFFKVFLLIHLIFLTSFLLARTWRSALMAAIVLVMAYPAVSSHFGLHLSPSKPEGKTLRILTYNIMGLSYSSPFEIARADSLFNHIHKLKPDVVCLQELSYVNRNKSLLQKLQKECGLKYFYTSFDVNWRHANVEAGVGQAILSRYRLFNFRHVLVVRGSSNGAISTDVCYGDDTLSLINVHFQSIGLSKREYNSSGSAKGYESTVTKVRNAFLRRGRQVDQVKKAAEEVRHPLIICGDFNDTPQSYTYHTMSGGMLDTWLENNFGMGSTFAGPLPYLRIDYILTPPGFGVQNSKVMHWTESDHYALMSEVVVK